MSASRPPSPNAAEQAHQRGMFEGQVIATLTDIKGKLDGIGANLAAIEVRTRSLEARVVSLEGTLRELDDKGTQASEREHARLWHDVDALKSWRWFLMGAVAVAGFAGPLVLRYVFHLS